MKAALAVALLLLSTTTLAWDRDCMSWRTVTETDRWGHSRTYTQCIERARPQHHIHYHHHHEYSTRYRGNDVLLGVVIGAGAYHILERDRRRHREWGNGPARHCYRDRGGVWRCR